MVDSIPVLSRKRMKRSKKKASSSATLLSCLPSMDDVDHFTSLPEPLRLRILTLISYKAAIRSGALSSQWRDLWKIRYSHRQPCNLNIQQPLSLHVAVRLLESYKPNIPLNSIHLSYHCNSNDHIPYLHRFVMLASQHHLEDLSLDLHDITPRFFSFGISSNFPHLVHLSLTGFFLANRPSYFKQFTKLEVLNLHAINIKDSALRRIISYCPLIRTVDVRCCPDLKNVVIRALRTGLNKLSNVVVVGCDNVAKVNIGANIHLKKFHYCGEILNEYCLENPLLLEDVYMSFQRKGTNIFSSGQIEKLGSLPLLRILTICSLALQMLILGANTNGNMQSFDNLKELQLVMDTMSKNNLKDIYTLFQIFHFPKLEKLFIELPKAYENALYTANLFQVQEEVPLPEVFTCLKTIRIKNFNGFPYEMKLVEFFLLEAVHLESLIVVIPEKGMENDYLTEVQWHSHMVHYLSTQFSQIPKSSMKARIVVYHENVDSQAHSAHDLVYYKI